MPINTDSLQHQFEHLQSQLQQTDVNDTNWFNHSEVFVSSAFHTQSSELSDYLEELQQNIKKLSSLSDPDYMEYLADKITQQFSCLRSFMQSGQVEDKDKLYKKNKFAKVNRAKQLVNRSYQSSQNLYAELSKLQEFERRLLDMVSEKQQALHRYQGTKLKAQYQQDVLAHQQRLGRCRQALSKVEEQIQKLDERN